MIRTFKYLIPILSIAAWSCSKSETGGSSMPEAGTTPISWKVESVDSPASRSLVGPEFDDEGNPYTDRDWITLENACTPTANGGKGQAIGIWADCNYTDGQGNDVTRRNIFQDTRLIFAEKANGNPWSNWNYEGSDLYWLKGGRYKFRAYYPEQIGDNVISSATASTFVIEYPTHDMQEDLLLAYNHVDTTDPQVDLSQPVALRFSHGLAAIRFFVKATYSNTDYLTSCWLQNADSRDFATSGILAYGSEADEESISWVNGYNPPVTERIYYWKNSGVEFSSNPTEGSSIPAMAYTQTGTSEGDLFVQNNGWVLILPQQSSGNLQFCFTTQSGEEAVYRVPIPRVTERIKASDGSVVESTEYLPGKRYTYTISITETNLILDLTVADWNERESSHSIVF